MDPTQADSTASGSGVGLTSASFVEAGRLGLQLSSHGADHAPSLTRGKACQTCKTRKVRCDGVRPVCGSCARSAAVHGDTTEQIVCSFADPGPPPKRQRKARPRAMDVVAQLQARIAELEAQLPARHSSGSSTSATTPDASTSAKTYSNTLAGGELNDYAFLTDPAAPLPDLAPFATAIDPSLHSPMNAAFDFGWMTFPGQDTSLPSPPLLAKLVDVFFASKTNLYTGLVPEAQFRAALLYPPNDVRYPYSALLHAIILSAGKSVTKDLWATEFRYWGEGDVLEFHRSRVIKLTEHSFGDKAISLIQATTLLCCSDYLDARFGEVFAWCGAVVRMCIPSGINHIRKGRQEDGILVDRPAYLRTTAMSPTTDEAELNNRATAFWFARTCDIVAAASTGWTMAIYNSHISTPLPSLSGEWPNNDYELASWPLNPHNPLFYQHHPPALVGPVQFMFKAFNLMGDVLTFLHGLPAPFGLATDKPFYYGPLNETPEFRKLDATVQTFQRTLPREYQSLEVHTLNDTRLGLITSAASVALILLHEPFAEANLDNPAMKACIKGAKEIYDSICQLWASSYDLAKSVAFLNFCWTVAGRTMVRQLAIKLKLGISEGVDDIRTSVLLIAATMRGSRTPLGNSSAATLETLLSNPSHCLPQVYHTQYAAGHRVPPRFRYEVDGRVVLTPPGTTIADMEIPPGVTIGKSSFFVDAPGFSQSATDAAIRAQAQRPTSGPTTPASASATGVGPPQQAPILQELKQGEDLIWWAGETRTRPPWAPEA